MERPESAENRSTPSTVGATIGIPPERAASEAFHQSVSLSTKDAIYTIPFQNTRCGAVFPVVDKPKTETVLN
jgi:hypothetical protein